MNVYLDGEKGASSTNTNVLSTNVTVVHLLVQKNYWLQPFTAHMPDCPLMLEVLENLHSETWNQWASVLEKIAAHPNCRSAAEILRFHSKSVLCMCIVYFIQQWKGWRLRLTAVQLSKSALYSEMLSLLLNNPQQFSWFSRSILVLFSIILQVEFRSTTW